MKAIYNIYVNERPNEATGLFATLKRAKIAAEKVAQHASKPAVAILRMDVYPDGSIESEDCGQFVDGCYYNYTTLSVR